jgi:conjugative transfer signal peptidase TraF
MMGLTLGGIGLIIGGVIHTRHLLVWNGSASAPLGLYMAQSGHIEPGDWVLVTPSPALQKLIHDRHYLPEDVPLIKQVRGVAGDVVCRVEHVVTINKIPVARALKTDAQGRALPAWQGCIDLKPDQIFLLNRHPRSLDGRYFGVTHTSDVDTKLRLVWQVH